MAYRWTDEDLKVLKARGQVIEPTKPRQPVVPSVPERAPEPPKRNKYGAVRTEEDGITFDSKHEAMVWRQLKLEAGERCYKGIARQVTFFLPGGVKYVADFVVFNPNGSYTVIDAKSEATKHNAVYRLKKQQMRECLGIEIKEM